ncbi:hypothetical protein VP01_1264g1 [Puccinia sorghi]|uniref:Exocyst complex subunit EXOC6/Sec15 C-terminal domain-containing protein n=1 Tax=Puccinia sorghi TaxID=27349 RepID=A0A0L6VQL5_9BASI|nr:hypothetical protein VP01_1264g1 [Puccinia sorghi]
MIVYNVLESQDGSLIDFSPLYLAIHIHDTLDAREELQKSFRDDRRAQAHLILASMAGNTSGTSAFTLESLGALFEQIVGFFIIETQILRTTKAFRDENDVDSLWQELSDQIVRIVRLGLMDCSDVDLLLGVKTKLLLFSQTLESYDYPVSPFHDLLGSFATEYTELLFKKFSQEFEQFILEDDHQPMQVHNEDEFSKVVEVSFLPTQGPWTKTELAKLSPLLPSQQKKKRKEPLFNPSISPYYAFLLPSSQSFPAALPFSQAYPLCCIHVRNYVAKHYAYCESITRDADDSIRKSLDSLLISHVGLHIFNQITRTKNLSQLAQIVINILFFLTACDGLETMLVQLRVSARFISPELEAKPMLKKLLKTGEQKILSEIQEKIQDFFELSEYDWRRKSAILLDDHTAASGDNSDGTRVNEQEISIYLRECLNFIDTLIDNVLVLTPPDFNENIFFGAWRSIGERLKSFLIDREPMAISDGGLSVLKNDIHFAFRRLRQSSFSTSSSPISIEITKVFHELVQVQPVSSFLSSRFLPDVGMYLDETYRSMKYALVRPETLPLMFVKLLTCMNSVGSNVDPLRKSSVVSFLFFVLDSNPFLHV